MDIFVLKKDAFAVIGKEGSTLDGDGFIQKLWHDAQINFAEVAQLAKRKDGALAGFWGVMSDFSKTFMPWQNNFSEGLYLAGVEVGDSAEPPGGWVKWVVPGYEYYVVKATTPTAFQDMQKYLADHSITLAGTVHDFTEPGTGINYMYFPVKRL